jgi:hypothetical protein
MSLHSGGMPMRGEAYVFRYYLWILIRFVPISNSRYEVGSQVVIEERTWRTPEHNPAITQLVTWRTVGVNANAHFSA